MRILIAYLSAIALIFVASAFTGANLVDCYITLTEVEGYALATFVAVCVPMPLLIVAYIVFGIYYIATGRDMSDDNLPYDLDLLHDELDASICVIDAQLKMLALRDEILDAKLHIIALKRDSIVSSSYRRYYSTHA